ncbi:hypothetical protein DPMN_120432 [Dreissena polymorpha]|uniref:Uncharacterized protein n=1 Tax=Dreissena polymorpha TaxID=45954 RepID=A0A9D4GK71_DREPO|nr:hypothetical protein DPMN_120432 [Dreissena polymorpha]
MMDDTKVETVCRTISLVLSELSQLTTGFNYCYENEMKQWCNKSPPNLTQLGAAFKRVHRLLQQLIQVIKQQVTTQPHTAGGSLQTSTQTSTATHTGNQTTSHHPTSHSWGQPSNEYTDFYSNSYR